jgi:mannose-6-phosphate isomerase-like protein (cupin superfamily)
LAAIEGPRCGFIIKTILSERARLMSVIELSRTYVHLDGESARAIPADGFWERLASDGGDPTLARVAAGGWLVATFPYDKNWDFWEAHPDGDEVVTLVAGEIELIFDEEGGERRVPLRASETVVVPRGVWHRAMVTAPGAALHITFGRGTRHRPLEDRGLTG